MFAEHNYNITVEAADHGKPVRSATALIHILLSPPLPPPTQEPLTEPPLEESQPAVAGEDQQRTAEQPQPTAAGQPQPKAGGDPQLKAVGDPQPVAETKVKPPLSPEAKPPPPGLAEQPRSQASHGSSNNPAGANSLSAAKIPSPLLSTPATTTTENRTHGAVFKKEVYSVQVVENVDTPLVVLALGRELVVGGGAAVSATYRIVGSNYGMFHVGETTGDLVLTASPDREEKETYILRIKVMIGGVTCEWAGARGWLVGGWMAR